MIETSASPKNSLLNAAINKFDHWRKTRDKRTKIPHDLWALVPPLLEMHRSSEVASALKLNPAMMKKEVDLLQNPTPADENHFIECHFMQKMTGQNKLSIELTNKSGITVKVTDFDFAQLKPMMSILIGCM